MEDNEEKRRRTARRCCSEISRGRRHSAPQEKARSSHASTSTGGINLARSGGKRVEKEGMSSHH